VPLPVSEWDEVCCRCRASRSHRRVAVSARVSTLPTTVREHASRIWLRSCTTSKSDENSRNCDPRKIAAKSVRATGSLSKIEFSFFLSVGRPPIQACSGNPSNSLSPTRYGPSMTSLLFRPRRDPIKSESNTSAPTISRRTGAKLHRKNGDLEQIKFPLCGLRSGDRRCGE
jgi:hypothetical protein